MSGIKQRTAAKVRAATATTNDDPSPATRLASLAKFKADMIEWHARQERAREARLALAKHRNRNIRRKLANAPGPGAGSSYAEAYYEGGFRMVIDGVPIRMAAHVKNWKATNRAALCQGSDLFGLVPSAPKHAKNRRYWYSDDLEAACAMAGDLFDHGPEHQEKIAAGLIGRALSRRHYVYLGGGRHEEMPLILFEEHAARAIGWALHVYGFYFCEEARMAA